MKFFILFLTLLLPCITFCQQQKNIDEYKDSISKNIFRIAATIDRPNSLALQYEREIKKTFTVVTKFGFTLSFQKFGDINNGSNKKNQYAFGVFGTLEPRYYFTLNRRIKSKKAIHNFSAFYLSLEQSIASNPFIFINQTKSQALQGSIESFANIGWQKQYKNFYFNAYIGATIYKKTLSKYFPDQHIDGSHGGLAIGLVF